MRLIDADAIPYEIERIPFDEEGFYVFDTTIAYKNDIDRLPTIDHESLRARGWWTTKRTALHDGEPWCANCGESAVAETMTRYCPSCGAKMEMSE